VTNFCQQTGVEARYLVSYDWPEAANAEKILLRLKRIVVQLGITELQVMAQGYGKKKPVSTDFFKIKDFSAIQSLETINERGPAGSLGGLYYDDNKNLNMAMLCIAICTHPLQPSLVVNIIRALHEVDGIGYAIAFDAPLGKKAMYYALGMTFGEVKTHYENMLAHELGRFFFQSTRKNRNDRAYNRDKIRNVYPVNVLNPLQKQIMQAETGLNEGRFTCLGDDRHLLVLDDEEVFGLREKLVRSAFLI
jgi:hypothetical protein